MVLGISRPETLNTKAGYLQYNRLHSFRNVFPAESTLHHGAGNAGNVGNAGNLWFIEGIARRPEGANITRIHLKPGLKDPEDGLISCPELLLLSLNS